ncbi:MAG: OmpH family outer membrane protein [Bacteroidaceae bacterium]|nr:OmpH family outer membrane protein [Bacteroidaceae bacterium]
MKKTIVTATLLALTAMVSAQEVADDKTSAASSSAETIEKVIYKTQRFGFLSYDEALKSMPEYSIAQKSLEDLKATYDREMERAEQEFTKKYSEYIDGQGTFPENIMLKRQKELQQLMDQSIAFKNEAKKMLVEAERETMKPLYEQLNKIIKEIGEEYKFSYILNTDCNAYPYINTSVGEGQDINDIVKTALNK